MEEVSLVKKETGVLSKNIQKDEIESRAKIKKITDNVTSQVENIEKSYFDGFVYLSFSTYDLFLKIAQVSVFV